MFIDTHVLEEASYQPGLFESSENLRKPIVFDKKDGSFYLPEPLKLVTSAGHGCNVPAGVLTVCALDFERLDCYNNESNDTQYTICVETPSFVVALELMYRDFGPDMLVGDEPYDGTHVRMMGQVFQCMASNSKERFFDDLIDAIKDFLHQFPETPKDPPISSRFVKETLDASVSGMCINRAYTLLNTKSTHGGEFRTHGLLIPFPATVSQMTKIFADTYVPFLQRGSDRDWPNSRGALSVAQNRDTYIEEIQHAESEEERQRLLNRARARLYHWPAVRSYVTAIAFIKRLQSVIEERQRRLYRALMKRRRREEITRTI